LTLYAVVPVKNLGVSKRRLSAVFTPQERKQLTLAMLEDVLAALKASVVNKILVIGEDPQVQQTAEKSGAAYLSTTKVGLNPAIEEAVDWCVEHSAGSVLVLPADVPFVIAKDINRVVELGVGNCAVVLSPSSNWGTNALFQHPPKLIPACFGSQSFLAHICEAYRRGISVRLHFSAGLATDIDSAEDLRKVFEVDNATECRRVLEQITRNSSKAMDFFDQKTKAVK
jgi:2-phospho-L-lactate/phosphoenolpyruvate guanylyltransferase